MTHHTERPIHILGRPEDRDRHLVTPTDVDDASKAESGTLTRESVSEMIRVHHQRVRELRILIEETDIPMAMETLDIISARLDEASRLNSMLKSPAEVANSMLDVDFLFDAIVVK